MPDRAEAPSISVEEYLAGEAVAPVRHEYVAVEVSAMPASPSRPAALRLVLVLLVLCLVAPWLSAADGAKRDLILIEGGDYFGHDYATRKDVSQADCQAACLADARCLSFTYNVSTRWCFLKSDYGELRPFAGAVTGRILTGSPATRVERRAARLGELRFLPPGYAD
ncbi:PAN/Apple domain-containing protein, partial [Thioalkalicoccus limnaeus]